MAEGKRIGVVSSERNAEWLEEVLSDRLTSPSNTGGTFEEILDYYQATNVRTIVVDDDVLFGRPEAEESLARWAKGHGHPRVRIVLYVDSGRDVGDPYLFRLVSDAEVRDILVAAENGDPGARLLQLVDEPMAPIEYERWRTNDPTVWQKGKPGLLESIFGSPKKSDKKKKKKKGKKDKRRAKGLEPRKDGAVEAVAPEANDAVSEEGPVPTPGVPDVDGNGSVGDEACPSPTEPGDVASVYGIDLDDDAGEVTTNEDETKRGLDMAEGMTEKEEEGKRIALDLAREAVTEEMPEVGPVTPPDEDEGEEALPPLAKSTETKEDAEGGAPVRDEEAAPAAVVPKELVGGTVSSPEAVPARATGDLTPGTVTLTFPGASLSSILETFVRPGAERGGGVSFPTAKSVVAVSALRPGMGCSHVSVAIGTALAAEGVAVSVALRTRYNLSRMLDGLSDSFEVNGVGVKWHGCDFYYWEDQRRFSSDYDMVVADCGVLETADNSRNSPTNLFVNHARASILLTGGSPWDIPLLDAVFSRYDARTTRDWRFGCCRTTPEILESFERSFEGIYGDGRKRMWPVPYSPSLFDGSTPRLQAYRDALEPALPKSLRYQKAPQARPKPAEEDEAKSEVPSRTDVPKEESGHVADPVLQSVHEETPEAGSSSVTEGRDGAPQKPKRTRNRSRGKRGKPEAPEASE